MPLVRTGLGPTSTGPGSGGPGLLARHSSLRYCLLLVLGVRGSAGDGSHSIVTTRQWYRRGLAFHHEIPPSWGYSGNCSGWLPATISQSGWCMSPRKHNAVADALSRNLMTRFFALAGAGRPPALSHSTPPYPAVESRISALVWESRAPSTAATYRAGIQQFVAFCYHHRLALFQRASSRWWPLQPTSPQLSASPPFRCTWQQSHSCITLKVSVAQFLTIPH